MSSRTETGPPAVLLRELPTGWAQAIITSPTRAELQRSPGVLFSELHRVLREDGTFWLLSAERHLPQLLIQRGWLERPVGWATQLRIDPAGRTRLHLLVKHPHYHCNTHTTGLLLAPRTRAAVTRACSRREDCWNPERRRELMRLCVLAGSSRVACGACGAPYTHTPHSARHPTCAHRDTRGHCLILDPFCHPGSGLSEITTRLGRAFLGITPDRANAR
jgi:hypothetical protein